MEKKHDLEEKLVDFAGIIIKVVDTLPGYKAAVHLGGQLLRSGISSAFTYSEAQIAESTADYLQKTRVILKELRETQINLKIIERQEYLPKDLQEAVNDACRQLVAIFTKSVETAKKNVDVFTVDNGR
jgi:four helix bundle protein